MGLVLTLPLWKIGGVAVRPLTSEPEKGVHVRIQTRNYLGYMNMEKLRHKVTCSML